MTHVVAPSILAADFAKLGEEVEMLERSKAQWIHIDVMDGQFVPNISFGFPVLEAIRKHSSKFLDVHLMMENPERYFADFKNHGADGITVHIEACTHIHRAIQEIKELDMKAGVVLNPGTPIASLYEVIRKVDLALVMSVNPGFGGQKFIPESLRRIQELKELITSTGSKAKIQVDGGVGPKNALEVLNAGADIIVAGSAVFGAEDPTATIAELIDLKPNNILA